MMNWTGGEYHKAAPGKHNALQQHQKAHFAKARAAALLRSSNIAHRQASQTLPYAAGSRMASIESSSHARQPSASQVTTDAASLLDDQELRLLEKRQELLNRSDWLGLSAARPLRMTFEGEAEKQMFGRRRRLPKHRATTHRRAKPLGSPSDALYQPPSQESIQIKIGTDALTNPTQCPALPAVNDPRKRQRALSELDDLSEEPMLLDSDDEVFERCTSVSTSKQVRSASKTSRPNMLPSQIAPMRHPPMSPTHHKPNVMTTTELPLPWSTSPQQIRPSIETASVVSDKPDNDAIPRLTEKRWQRVLGVATTSQYCHSNMAVRSFKDTPSESTTRVCLLPRRRRLSPGARTSSRGDLTLNISLPTSMRVLPSQAGEMQDYNVKHFTHDEPPSRSAQTEAQRVRSLKHDQNSSDEIWRQFIIGDESDDST